MQVEACFPALLAGAQGMPPASWPAHYLQLSWAALTGNGMVDGSNTGSYQAATGSGVSSGSCCSQQIDMAVRDELGMVWRWGLKAWHRSHPAGYAKASHAASAPHSSAVIAGPNVAGFMLTNTGRRLSGTVEHLTMLMLFLVCAAALYLSC